MRAIRITFTATLIIGLLIGGAFVEAVTVALALPLFWKMRSIS